MKQPTERSRFVLIGTYLLAVAVPLLAKAYLHAPIATPALLLLVLPVVALGYAARRYREHLWWLPWFSGAVNAVAGGLVMVGVLITPLSAYQSWFDSFRYGVPEGGVSNLFVLLIAFYAAAIAPTSLTMGPFWPVIMIGFVLLFLLAIIVQTQGLLVALLAFLILPAAYVAFRSAARSGRERIFAFSLSLVGVAFVVAMAVPTFDTPPGDEFVNERLYPELRSEVQQTFPQFPLLYSVPGYGISFDEKQLGGVPTLLPNPIFTVEGGEPRDVVYLRTRAFDSYDGSSWSMSPFFSGRTTDALRNPLFGEPPAAREDDLRVEITTRTFGYVPHTLDTDLIVADRGIPEIAEGSVDTGFRLRRPLRDGDTVYLRRRSESAVVTNLIDEEERVRYLQIPDDLPDELRVVAAGLSEGTEEAEQILTNIQVFLQRNYTYSLEVDDFAPAEFRQDDFVYSFLFSQSSGYCVQFATSFIILARLNGIPARYATGYLSYFPPDETTAEITGLSAHAWPEVWIEGRGWVNWEATPAANIANYREEGDDWVFDFGVELNSTTSRQIESLIGASMDGEEDRPAGSRNADRFATVLLYVLLAVGGLAAGAAVIFLGIRWTRYLTRDERGRFFQLTRRLARSMKRRGVPRPESTGWDAWFTELARRTADREGRLEPTHRVIMRVTYAEDPVTAESLRSLTAFGKYLRREMRGHRQAR